MSGLADASSDFSIDERAAVEPDIVAATFHQTADVTLVRLNRAE
jgi:hypothetical protein